MRTTTMLETRGEVTGKAAAQTATEISPDRLYRKAEVARLEGIGPTTLHHRLIRGEYTAVRDGTAAPKISGASILRRRELHLRPATYGKRAGIRGVPSKAEPASGVVSAGKRPRKEACVNR
jgi:hypothetical protein